MFFLGRTLLVFALLHSVIQAYAPTSNTEEAEVEQFYEDLQDFLELTPKKDVMHGLGLGLPCSDLGITK